MKKQQKFGKLHLRPLVETDINNHYLGWVNDEEVTKYLSTTPPVSMEDLWAYFNRMTASNQHRIFAITVNSFHIGNITLNDINWDAQKANMGIMIGEKEYWNKGYGTEAIRQLICIAHNLGLNKLWLGVEEDNIPAYKAYLKAGFHTVTFGNKGRRMELLSQ